MSEDYAFSRDASSDLEDCGDVEVRSVDRITVAVEHDQDSVRLDKFLASAAPPERALSRARLQALIRDGHVAVNGAPNTNQKSRVSAGDVVSVDLPPPIDAVPEPQAMPLSIVFEDDALIVIDKPAGLVVHPGAGHHDGTLVNALLAHCGNSLSGIGGVARPGIVHRLDRDTSGLLVAAKTDQAHRSLSQQFAAHGRDGRLKRVYSALVWGGFPNPSGTIDLPLARSTTHRTRIAVARPGQGREAVTHYVVRDAFHLEGQTDGVAGVSYVDVMLETGRTHQIRVHMAAVRHPVLGDPVYASGYQSKLEKLPADAQDALGDLGRQALHARTLGFEHPVTRSAMEFDSALPPDMAKLLLALR